MLSKFSVKKPYTVVVAVVLVIILGIVSFSNMTVDLLPSMNLPYAIVMTNYVGASPEEVEMTVTKPIEQSMATISNISSVSSTSRENASIVVLEFEQTANMDAVTVEMREKLDQISGYWPDTVGNPMIMKLNPDMMPVMVAAVSVTGEDVAGVTGTIENEILPEMESIEGVASVSASGAIEESIEITVSPGKIQNLNEDVKAQLDQKFAEAEKALQDAKAQVESGKQALESTQQQMNAAGEEISKKEAEISQGQLETAAKLKELELAETELNAGLLEVNTQETALKAQKQALEQLKMNETAIREAYAEVSGAIDAGYVTEELLAQKAQLEQQIGMLDQYEVLSAQMEEGLKSIEDAKKEISDGFAQIEEGKAALAEVKEQLNAGKISLTEARGQLNSAQITAASQITTAKIELALGEQTIDEQTQELEGAKDGAYESADLSNILTLEMIKNILIAQNFNMPAGYVQEQGIDYLIRVGDKFEDIEELENLVLFHMQDMDPVRLSDVAEVKKADNSSEVYAKMNGEPGMVLSIQKQTGYSTGDVSKRLLKKFEALETEHADLQIVTLMDQGVYIDLIVNSVLQNLLFGAILAILVLLLFLKDVRPTIVIACSIPISLLAAVVLMYFSGVTLNVISLSGLALAVGMLVDNSIVVIENIYRMRNEGASAKKAAIEGAKQVAGAIVASTLTTICVFAPIVFTKGITRQLFVDMGLTIAYSLLASLVVALTLVPMMAAGLLKKTEAKESKFFVKVRNTYGKLLGMALRKKTLVLLGALLLLVVSAVLSLRRGTEFMPAMESPQISMTVTTEEGTSLQETAGIADEVMEKLLAIPDVADVGAMASSDSLMGLGGSVSTNVISIYAILEDNPQLSNQELQARIEEDTKDIDCELELSMSSMDMSALGNSGIVISIKGKELDILQQTADEVAAIVEQVKGTQNVSNGMEETTEELRIIVDKEKAMEHNLTVAQIYQEIAGQLRAAGIATTLSTSAKDYDVFVLDEKQESLTREDIRQMTIAVTKQDGAEEEIRLSDIVSFEDAQGLQAINRQNQNRYINVTAEIAEGDNIGLVSNRIQEALKKYEAPKGYTIEMAGEDETIAEAMGDLLKMLGLAIVFMYLIMVAQFQSLRSPFIIMFTIPLAFTGGFLGLFLTGSPISVIAMIGFIMLSGIIVNNGIVFVDYANQLIDGGMDKNEALIETGKTRLRPIIMTALTTILGLFTMALGMGQGADMVQPMAIVTVGGLIYGTLLTLFVVPCIYALFNRREKARLREGIE